MQYTTKKDFDEVLNKFIGEFSSIDTGDINKIPFDGSWTAGELGQHIRLSVAGFSQVLNGPVKATERAPDAQIPVLKKIFLDYSSKMKSPDFIDPEKKEYDQDELAGTLQQLHTDISKSIDELDLTQTCTGFELPNMGFLTRLEAIYFVIYHTQRHTHQLENIKAELAKS